MVSLLGYSIAATSAGNPLMPLTLYHATRGAVLESILHNGIRPRTDGSGNWPHMPSRPGRVYFADSTQLVYAANADKKGPGWIFEVTMPDEVLQSSKLGPDEDAIGSTIGREQGWWRPASMTDEMVVKMQKLIATIDVAKFSNAWSDYLERTGSISYEGTVPPSYIVRYARIEVCSIPEVLSIWKDFNNRSHPGDPKNGQVLPQYKAMIRRVYTSITRAIMNGVPFDQIDELYPADLAKRRKRIRSFHLQLASGVRQFKI